MSLIGNGIKSEKAGKSGITSAFTSPFLEDENKIDKRNLGKGDFVNRYNSSFLLQRVQHDADLHKVC